MLVVALSGNSYRLSKTAKLLDSVIRLFNCWVFLCLMLWEWLFFTGIQLLIPAPLYSSQYSTDTHTRTHWNYVSPDTCCAGSHLGVTIIAAIWDTLPFPHHDLWLLRGSLKSLKFPHTLWNFPTHGWDQCGNIQYVLLLPEWPGAQNLCIHVNMHFTFKMDFDVHGSLIGPN